MSKFVELIEELRIGGIEEHFRYLKEEKEDIGGWDGLFLSILALPNEQLKQSYFERFNEERGDIY
jgi:hypothetical protein